MGGLAFFTTIITTSKYQVDIYLSVSNDVEAVALISRGKYCLSGFVDLLRAVPYGAEAGNNERLFDQHTRNNNLFLRKTSEYTPLHTIVQQ